MDPTSPHFAYSLCTSGGRCLRAQGTHPCVCSSLTQRLLYGFADYYGVPANHFTGSTGHAHIYMASTVLRNYGYIPL